MNVRRRFVYAYNALVNGPVLQRRIMALEHDVAALERLHAEIARLSPHIIERAKARLNAPTVAAR